MCKNYILVFFFLFIIHTPIYAQFRTVGHYEFNTENKEGTNYQFIPTEASELFAVFSNEKIFPGTLHQFIVYFFNEKLEKQWEIELVEKKIDTYITHYYCYPYLYILLQDTKRGYIIYRIEKEKGEVKKDYLINFPAITHLKVFNDKIYFSGFLNDVPFLAYKEFQQKKIYFVKSINIPRAMIFDFFVKYDNLFVFLWDKTFRKNYLFINKYDMNGDIIWNFSLRNEKSNHYRLQTKQIFIHDYSSFSILGLFTIKNQVKPQGIYLYSFYENRIEDKKYIYFSNFKNIFKNYNTKKEQKVITQITKKKLKGKIYKFNNLMFIHPIQALSDAYIISADIYDLKKQKQVNMNMFPYNYHLNSSFSRRFVPASYYAQKYIRNSSSMNSLYDNRWNYGGSYGDDELNMLEYVYSIVAKITKKGYLLWDNLYKYEKNTVLQAPLKMFSYIEYKDSLLMLAQQKDDLNYKISLKKRYSDTLMKLNLSHIHYPEDTAMYLLDGNSIKLSDNSIVLSGYKVLQNKKNSNIRKNLYYITKLIYD